MSLKNFWQRYRRDAESGAEAVILIILNNVIYVIGIACIIYAVKCVNKTTREQNQPVQQSFYKNKTNIKTLNYFDAKKLIAESQLNNHSQVR